MNQFQSQDVHDQDKFKEDVDVNIKVIVITIACCHKLSDTLGIWDNLKEVLIEEIDKLIDNEDVVLCLNIHNSGNKV